MATTIHQKIADIQQAIKVPKERDNKFGGFKYRSLEDILKALKPLLKKHKMSLMFNDSIHHLGDRYYLCAAVGIIDMESGEKIGAQGFAREEPKKGMDDAMATGATSSYARKYALNGVFLIDDSDELESMDHGLTEDQEKLIKGLENYNKDTGGKAKAYLVSVNKMKATDQPFDLKLAMNLKDNWEWFEEAVKKFAGAKS